MRIARRTCVALLVTLLVSIAGIHTYAQVFRWRAERLLTRLRSVQVEQTPATAVLALRDEYRSNLVDNGPCTEQSC
jgi:cytochrome c-type biogenesis protein CcmH/NrfG